MSDLSKFFGIDKVANLIRMIKQIGGVKAAIKQRYLMDQTRAGELVGEDKFGNKYYKNDTYFMPRNRWVQYSEKVWLDYDASQVPPEWHRWLHHMTDEPPTVKPPVDHKWILEHKENSSIYQDEKYIPYSTTRPKVVGWEPNRKKLE